MLNCKLGLSATGKPINEELFSIYAEAGIEAMEIAVKPWELQALDFSELKRLSLKYGVRLWSMHMPFTPFETFDISMPKQAQNNIPLFMDYIKKASEAGVKVFVVHASGEPVEENSHRAQRISVAKNSLKQLADYAETLGCYIAVEDLPRSCLGNSSQELLELVSAHPNLKVCFDTNHLLGEDILEFIRNVGDKIITTHISDYDFYNERHWLPGEGKIDWQALTNELEKVGYNGYWLYEIDFETPWSIERKRPLNCHDFKRNFDEIMQGKEITKLGTPKQNLGMWDFLK